MIIKLINLFPVAGVKHLMVRHVINTLNAWILFYKTSIATENCNYNKLLKTKLTSAKHFPSLLFLQINLQPQWICTEHVKFFKVIWLLHSSRLFFIYFPGFYISNLTVEISSMFCTDLVETVKSCISLFLLVENLCFQVVSFFAKNTAELHFKLSKNLQ